MQQNYWPNSTLPYLLSPDRLCPINLQPYDLSLIEPKTYCCHIIDHFQNYSQFLQGIRHSTVSFNKIFFTSYIFTPTRVYTSDKQFRLEQNHFTREKDFFVSKLVLDTEEWNSDRNLKVSLCEEWKGRGRDTYVL